jgi:hypothetical protein
MPGVLVDRPDGAALKPYAFLPDTEPDGGVWGASTFRSENIDGRFDAEG